MIEELKDLWIVFRKVYNEHFAMKIQARDAIKEYKSKMDSIGRVYNLLNETYHNLDEVYLQLPIKERKDIIQPTIDLLRWGIRMKEDGSYYGNGFIVMYSNLHYKMKSDYKYINLLYKEKKYDLVIETIDMSLECLENFYLEWNIKKQK